MVSYSPVGQEGSGILDAYEPSHLDGFLRDVSYLLQVLRDDGIQRVAHHSGVSHEVDVVVTSARYEVHRGHLVCRLEVQVLVADLDGYRSLVLRRIR